MTRIYTNPGAWWRNTVSMGILIIVAIYGVFELWRAANASGAEADLQGYLFGFAFVGGAAYGLWQLINDAADRVMTFDVDPAGSGSLVTLWRPFWTEKLAGGPDSLRDWRLHVAIGNRKAKTFFVYADHKGNPRPLQFELRQGIDVTGLRTVAPEAVSEFDQAIGRTT